MTFLSGPHPHRGRQLDEPEGGDQNLAQHWISLHGKAVQENDDGTRVDSVWTSALEYRIW
jgi:hypothetical protein